MAIISATRCLSVLKKKQVNDCRPQLIACYATAQQMIGFVEKRSTGQVQLSNQIHGDLIQCRMQMVRTEGILEGPFGCLFR